jgi:hypothetical protein
MPAWLPEREADRLVWLQNFALKLNLYVGTVGVTAGDVAAVSFHRDIFQWAVNRAAQIRTASQDLTEWKRILTEGPPGAPIGDAPAAPVYPAAPAGKPAPGIFPLIVALAERIRNTAGYTTAMGENLGIVAPAAAPPLGDPSFTARAEAGSEVRLDWVKGASDGVIVEGQRAAETAWTLLGTDRFSPYVDGREPLVAGQPEVRRYRMRYLDGDEPVGDYSPVATVTTVP